MVIGLILVQKDHPLLCCYSSFTLLTLSLKIGMKVVPFYRCYSDGIVLCITDIILWKVFSMENFTCHSGCLKYLSLS
jgi:hypothetical protein